MPNATASPTEGLVNKYLEGWKTKDANAIAACVHPEVTFTGPMSTSQGRDAFVAGAARMFPMLREHRVRSILTNRDQAMFVYDFVCIEPIGVCRTAEFVTLQDGLIGSVEIFFDARPFEKLMQSQARGPA